MPRRRAARPSASSGPPWGLIGLGAAAVGVGYLIVRSQSSAAATLPPTGSTPSTPVPSTIPTSTGGTAPRPMPPTYGPNGQDPPAALVARLRTSETARRVFALQALAYSYGFTDAVPDGIEGPVTDAIIHQLNVLDALPNEPSRMTDRTLGIAHAGLTARFGLNPQFSPLPYTLPQDVLDAVNRSAYALDPTYQTVQAQSTEAPAGWAAPFAGR